MLLVLFFYSSLLHAQVNPNGALPTPPDKRFVQIEVPAPDGRKLKALLCKTLEPQRKNPAIIWIRDGFPLGGYDTGVWEPLDIRKDLSAKVYRKEGVVVLYPTFRGGYGNAGDQEGFTGEVDDVQAMRRWLSRQPYVDPQQIYIGGHGSGATLALLAAQNAKEFRACVAFEPVAFPTESYDTPELKALSASEGARDRVSPLKGVKQLTSPTYIFSGDLGGKVDAEKFDAAAKATPFLHVAILEDTDRTDGVGILNQWIAKQIKLQNRRLAFELDLAKAQALLDEKRSRINEANEIAHIAELRRAGAVIDRPALLSFYFWSYDKPSLQALEKVLPTMELRSEGISHEITQDGEYFLLEARKELVLADLQNFLPFVEALRQLAKACRCDYNDWAIAEKE